MSDESNNENSKTTENYRVFKTGGKRKEKSLFVIKIEKSDVDSKTLDHIRQLITKDKTNKDYSQLHFCSFDGAVIPDEWTIKDYLAEAKGNEGKGKEIYLKRKYDIGRDDNPDLPDVDPELPDDAKHLPKPDVDRLKSTIDLAQWMASASGHKLDRASELSEKSWLEIVENNDLCYGLVIVRAELDDKKIVPIGTVRARYPAFRLKPMPVRASRIAAQPKPNPELHLQIPDFIVDDQAYVSIFETQSEFQQSLSTSSFSQWDISGAVGASFCGVKFGVGAGYKRSDSKKSVISNSRQCKRMNVSYNFPRATVLLDQYSLELTEQCKTHLNAVKDVESLSKFLDLFGEFFSTRVQLGGRLYASEEFTSSTTASASEVKNAMKFQAALSFKTDTLKGGPKGGYGDSNGTERIETGAKLETTLQWQANGGNTLLCNNPPMWCPTVGTSSNWRITRRDANCHIIDLLCQFEGQGRLAKFVKSLNYDFLDDTPDRAVKPALFYLRGLPKFESWTYLTLYQERNLRQKAIEDALKTMKRYKKDHGWEDPDDRFGTVLVSGNQGESNLAGLYLAAETLAGTGVQQPMYGEKYHIKNPSTNLYLSCSDEFPIVYREKPPKNEYWVFRGVDGTTQGPIKQWESVTLRIHEPGRHKDGDMIVKTRQCWYHAIITLSSELEQETESSFTFLYKEAWDEKQKSKLSAAVIRDPGDMNIDLDGDDGDGDDDDNVDGAKDENKAKDGSEKDSSDNTQNPQEEPTAEGGHSDVKEEAEPKDGETSKEKTDDHHEEESAEANHAEAEHPIVDGPDVKEEVPVDGASKENPPSHHEDSPPAVDHPDIEAGAEITVDESAEEKTPSHQEEPLKEVTDPNARIKAEDKKDEASEEITRAHH